MAVPPRLTRRSTSAPAFSSPWAKSSATTSCSVKFFEPMRSRGAAHAARNAGRAKAAPRITRLFIRAA